MMQYIVPGFLASQVIAFLVGMLSSAALILLLYFLVKPNLKISRLIAKIQTQGETWYAFKFVNKGYFFPLFDVRLELEYCRTIHVGDQANRSSQLLNLNRTTLLSVPKQKKRDEHRLHAVIIISKDHDIQGILEDEGAYLVLTLVARHGFSGTTKVLSQKFSKSSIRRGMFECGNKYDVIRPDD
jgi:hypothetical protein